MFAWAGVVLGDGAVVVAEAGLVFVAGEGGVSAIHLQDGSVAWTSPAGDLPLDADASRVVAWDASEPRQLEIVSLDVSTGAVIARCPARPTPEGWTLSLDDSLGGSSWVSAQLDGNQIRAWWGGETHFAGGEMPPEEIITNSHRSWLARTWRVSTGEPLADRPLARKSPSSASAIVSADGAHVAINSYGATSSSTLYRVADGAKVMDLPRAVAPGFVWIGGSCVMVETGLVTSDGAVRWTQPTHDRSYKGPKPQ
jgi:hypothetical protein